MPVPKVFVLERVDCSTSSNGQELKQAVYIHRTSYSWPRGAAQLLSVTEIAPKSPILCVNRDPIRYGMVFVPSQDTV